MSGIHRTPMGHWVVTADTVLRKWVEEFGTFEFPHNIETLWVVAPYIPEGGVVVEAGACIGDHTCSYARMVGLRGRVYAFEPHPDSYDALCRNTLPLQHVTVRPVALGEVRGVGRLIPQPNIGGSFIGQDPSSVDVRMSSLDQELTKYLTRLDFIHLDAEGYEPFILRGAEQLIKKFHPVMLVEVTDSHLKRYGSSETALLQQIASYGYQIERVPGSTQYDVLCLPMKPVEQGAPDTAMRHFGGKG